MLIIAIVLGYLLGAMITIVGIKCSGARELDPGIMTVMWPVMWVCFAVWAFSVGFEATADAIPQGGSVTGGCVGVGRGALGILRHYADMREAETVPDFM